MSNNQLNPNLWVDKYSDYLFNFTIVRVNDSEITKDLISETFLAGLKSKDNFKVYKRENLKCKKTGCHGKIIKIVIIMESFFKHLYLKLLTLKPMIKKDFLQFYQ